MTDRWLISIGAGRWQVSGIEAAKADGLPVFALDGSANAAGLHLADRSAVVDIRSARESIAAVWKAEIRPMGAIAFVNEVGLETAAALREEFGLPGPRRELTDRLVNKHFQRARWTEAGLPCPDWRCVLSEFEAESAIAQIGGTVILKPVDSSGSRGVCVVDIGADWRFAYGQACQVSRKKMVIVESFIDGTEFTVETFANRGMTSVLAVSEKRKVPSSGGTVAMELATSALPTDVILGIGQLAVNALAALGHTDGPGHTEILRKSDGSLWLVEAAGRGGGFMVADGIVPRASGFNLARACALQAVGLDPPRPPTGLPDRAFVLRFVPSRPGIVTGLSGFDRACELVDVDCQPLVSVGDRVGAPADDGARLAYILATAHDRAAAVALADRAEACIRIDISSC